MIEPEQVEQAVDDKDGGITRRRFIGYLIAAPTVVAAAEFFPGDASAAIPTIQPSDLYDLSDLLNNAAAPTSNLIRVIVNTDGTVSFALPRAEVGQGITTAAAMTIADEMDIAIEKVIVTLADARRELVFNQLTGGSNTMHSIFYPIRVAAAVARGQLLKAAAALFGEFLQNLTVLDGVISSTKTGRSATFGELAALAAVKEDSAVVNPVLKPLAQLRLVGSPQRRVDARAIVTGTKVFAMDLDIPGALPAMVCRPPTLNGFVVSVNNLADVRAMPGIVNVGIVRKTRFVGGGVAVVGQTFGQCIDAIRALSVNWGRGTMDGKSDADILADLAVRELPMTPALPGRVIDQTYTFHFRPGDPLEPNCAVADVRATRAEIWSSLKSPIWAKQEIAKILGLPAGRVDVHVTEGGGSFGRHLFADGAFEAATISRMFNRPVRLMWHRTDGYRQGRAHPMCTSRVRMTYLGNTVLAYDQRHTSVATDFTHGLGEILTATGAQLPGANSLGFSESIFVLTQNVPYNVGPVTQLLSEAYKYNEFNTSSVRNIYSPDVVTARELTLDRVARAMNRDPFQFRRSLAKDNRMRAVLDKLASVGNWGRPMPAGTAQGVAVHSEYKGRAACIVEIDTRPETAQRQIPNAYTGPRVTKVVYVVDVGLPINPLGLQAQMLGGIMDAIAQVLTFSLHFQNGRFIESSWDNAYYTRQWNVPPDVQVIVMPATTAVPGGAGEFGVAATMAAVACAYARATGTDPTTFPINHDLPLTFTPTPAVPPIPASPTDGLSRAF